MRDGIGMWRVASRLNAGKFIWSADGAGTLSVSRAQFDALVVKIGSPRHICNAL